MSSYLESRSVNEAEVTQCFRLLGVLRILDQQHAVRSIDIALGRAHGLLNALDSVAVSLPDFGGVNACHGFTLLKPKPCKQGFGLRPDVAQELALLVQWAFLFLATRFASPPYLAPGSGLRVTFDVPVADPIQGQSSTDYSARRSFVSRYRPRCPVFSQPCCWKNLGAGSITWHPSQLFFAAME